MGLQTIGLGERRVPRSPLPRRCAGQPLPASQKEVPDDTACDIQNFLSFFVQLAFYRQNPRTGIFAVPAKEGKEPPAPLPVTQCIKTFFSDAVPKMAKSEPGKFEKVLRADKEAKGIMQEYHEQLQKWYEDLCGGPGSEPGDDMFAPLVEKLTAVDALGRSTPPPIPTLRTSLHPVAPTACVEPR